MALRAGKMVVERVVVADSDDEQGRGPAVSVGTNPPQVAFGEQISLDDPRRISQGNGARQLSDSVAHRAHELFVGERGGEQGDQPIEHGHGAQHEPAEVLPNRGAARLGRKPAMASVSSVARSTIAAATRSIRLSK